MIAKQTGAVYWLPPKDAGEVAFKYEPLKNGGEVAIGSGTIRIEALHSPGHTIGSTSFVIDDQYLLTGDILFIDSIGRPDLAGLAEDWVGDLRETLYVRYTHLSEDLTVFAGAFHGHGRTERGRNRREETGRALPGKPWTQHRR